GEHSCQTSAEDAAPDRARRGRQDARPLALRAARRSAGYRRDVPRGGETPLPKVGDRRPRLLERCEAVVMAGVSSISCRLVVALFALGWGCGVSAEQADKQSLVANSNETPAGRLANGRLTVRLEAAMGDWSPEENVGPSLTVAAFREEGRS